jgi:hypothetical protein
MNNDSIIQIRRLSGGVPISILNRALDLIDLVACDQFDGNTANYRRYILDTIFNFKYGNLKTSFAMSVAQYNNMHELLLLLDGWIWTLQSTSTIDTNLEICDVRINKLKEVIK